MYAEGGCGPLKAYSDALSPGEKLEESARVLRGCWVYPLSRCAKTGTRICEFLLCARARFGGSRLTADGRTKQNRKHAHGGNHAHARFLCALWPFCSVATPQAVTAKPRTYARNANRTCMDKNRNRGHPQDACAPATGNRARAVVRWSAPPRRPVVSRQGGIGRVRRLLSNPR